MSGGEIKADDLDAITEQLERYSTVEHVLKAHPFRGINRKAQLKPCAWAEGDGEDGAPTECLFILKWGGELTALGEAQAESLGTRFRSVLYPGDEVGGLLRLHSTYRHDLKIYSSDEGRVQMTAAAFAKAFLDLDGDITPILASLVWLLVVLLFVLEAVRCLCSCNALPPTGPVRKHGQHVGQLHQR